MAEYIEREAVYSKLSELEELAKRRVYDTPTNSPVYMKYVSQVHELENFKKIISDFPADDVAPVVRGKINYRNRPEHYISYKSSGLTEGGDLLYKREHRILENNPVGYCSECGKRLCSRFTNYCPSCGAKMEKAQSL